MALSLVSGTFADDYLDSLEVESNKVESHSFEESKAGEQSDSFSEENALGGSLDNVELRKEFESHLSENNKGSFILFKKLPERSRQEVYDEFANGATMQEIRRLIVDRILQR